MAESAGYASRIDLNTEESLALYNLGKTISYLNDIIVRSQAEEPTPEYTSDLSSDALALFEKQLL
jgi:hypothetical protein